MLSQCQTINSLHRNGTQTGNPPQPSFICKRCSKTHNARTVYEITDTDNLQQLITQLREELKRTQLELQQARSEITQSREYQPHQASMPTSNPSTLPPWWRYTDRIQQLKQSLTSRGGEQRRAQQQETSARFLRPPSNNQGFQYIYIPTKDRIPFGQLRTHLRRLEINNSRILDIHYPARNLAALLVHNNYATELKDHLRYTVWLPYPFSLLLSCLLGIPFSPGGGLISALELVENNTTKALRTMNQLAAIELIPRGFRTLLFTRFYSQIIRP